VDKVKEVKDSLIVCLEKDRGEFYMPLLVHNWQPGVVLTDGIKKKINLIIRQDYSPRHVPDHIVASRKYRTTISGKKTRSARQKNTDGEESSGKWPYSGSLRNPEALNFFIEFYKTMSEL